MSLDGFIAEPNNDVSRLFQWYASGDTSLTYPDNTMKVKVSAARSVVRCNRLLGAWALWPERIELIVAHFSAATPIRSAERTCYLRVWRRETRLPSGSSAVTRMPNG